MNDETIKSTNNTYILFSTAVAAHSLLFSFKSCPFLRSDVINHALHNTTTIIITNDIQLVINGTCCTTPSSFFYRRNCTPLICSRISQDSCVINFCRSQSFFIITPIHINIYPNGSCSKQSSWRFHGSYYCYPFVTPSLMAIIPLIVLTSEPYRF